MKKTLLLFIHGLGGTAEDTWGKFPELIRADAQLSSQYEIGFYSYPTSLFRLPLFSSAPKIQVLAAGLRNQINNRFADFDDIVLIAHSLGGLVARTYLIEETKRKNPPRVSRLVLFAVPNNGAQLASVANFISWRHGQLSQLCRESDLISFINKDWFTFDLNNSIRALFVIGGQDNVVTEESASLFWGNLDIETIVDRGHRNLVKPASASEDVFLTLKRFLRKPLVQERGGTATLPPREVATASSPVQNTVPDSIKEAVASPFLPTRPLRCIGRDADTAELISALLTNESPTAVLVLGGAGMGKTTLTREAAVAPAVTGRFGLRRWFVELETATGAEALEKAIIVALGLDPATMRFDAALARLGEAPGLLVLDNLETPWDSERDKVEAVLASLHRVPQLALLASIRGNDPPASVRWTRQRTMHPLKSPHDSEMFRDIATSIERDDPNLAPLLTLLGGIPIVIELVAQQAAPHDTLAAVHAEWLRVGSALAKRRGVAPSKLSSLDVSLELSLGSPRLAEAGRRLFCILGPLPAGMAPEDVAALLGDAAFNARQELLSTALAIERGDRLDLLPPIRDHAVRHHPPANDDAKRWREHYLGLVRDVGQNIGRAEGAGAVRRLAPELANLDAAQRAALSSGEIDVAATSVRGVAKLMTYTGLGTAATIDAIATRCGVAKNTASEADCLFNLGEIALHRSDYGAARKAYERALPLYLQIDDVLRHANCIFSLGQIALRRADDETARRNCEQALPLYRQVGDIQGEANCIHILGNIALHRSDHEVAREAFEQARPLSHQIGDLVGEANCIRCLGDIARERSDHEAARKNYEDALPLYRQAGNILGEANCIQCLGDVALGRADHEAARKAFEQALPLYRQVGNLRGEANCIYGLGDIARAEADDSEARRLYEQALALFQRIPDPYSIGHVHRDLALVTSGNARAAHRAAAKEAWLSIGREDLVKEFGLSDA